MISWVQLLALYSLKYAIFLVEFKNSSPFSFFIYKYWGHASGLSSFSELSQISFEDLSPSVGFG